MSRCAPVREILATRGGMQSVAASGLERLKSTVTSRTYPERPLPSTLETLRTRWRSPCGGKVLRCRGSGHGRGCQLPVPLCSAMTSGVFLQTPLFLCNEREPESVCRDIDAMVLRSCAKIDMNVGDGTSWPHQHRTVTSRIRATQRVWTVWFNRDQLRVRTLSDGSHSRF